MKIQANRVIKWLCLFLLILIVGFTYASVNYGEPENSSEETSAEQISKQILRFHVIANSDSEEDQQLKMIIKNEIIKYLEAVPMGSLNETRTYLEENLVELEEIAAGIIEDNGYSYTAAASIENCYFPTKAYGDLTFPCGYYDALRIEIGEAEGKNWWCVLYPPLCFVDATHSVVPETSKELLKGLLDEKTYQELENSGSEDIQEILTENGYSDTIILDEDTSAAGGQDVQVRFKIAEWWDSLWD